MTRSAHFALQSFLNRLTLRSLLGTDEQQAILGLPYEPQHVRPNRDIIRPGEHASQATLVASGLVARFDARSSGARHLTAVYIQGDMCDLHSVPVPLAGWGLMALSEATILKVPHADLKRIAAEYPSLASAFWRDTVVDASVLSKWVANLGRRDSQARLAHFLCEMGTRFETAGLGSRDHFELNVTQGQLSEAVGITAVHVNRMFQQLRASGLITTTNRTIAITAWEDLRRLAEFDPAYLLLPA